MSAYRNVSPETYKLASERWSYSSSSTFIVTTTGYTAWQRGQCSWLHQERNSTV